MNVIDARHDLLNTIIIAAMGGIFTLGECVAKDIRKEDDALNAAIGGCAAGFLAGVRSKGDNMRKMLIF